LKDGIATVSMSIIAPHIKNTDTEDEWQKRTAVKQGIDRIHSESLRKIN